MKQKEHKHTIVTDPDTGDRYCSVCGEVIESEPLVQETAIDIKTGEPSGHSTGLGTTPNIAHGQAVGKSGRRYDILPDKQRYFVTTTDRVKEYAREHDIILNEDDLSNIRYYAGKFYDYKKAHKLQPHAKDTIIGYFVFLNCVQYGRNFDAEKVKPKNNSNFIKVMKELGISNSELKQLFITRPMIARWI
ncbi:MAG: TFIIB-type zinc ribbon-containing protein [Thermoplasmata archaeon]